MTPNISPSRIDNVRSSTALILFLSDVNTLLNPLIAIISAPPKNIKAPFCLRTERRIITVFTFSHLSKYLLCRNWHLSYESLIHMRLPRFHRASPSTAQDKRYHIIVVNRYRKAYPILSELSNSD